MGWESVPGDVTQWSRVAANHRLPPESEGDGYRMQHALAAALPTRRFVVCAPRADRQCS